MIEVACGEYGDCVPHLVEAVEEGLCERLDSIAKLDSLLPTAYEGVELREDKNFNRASEGDGHSHPSSSQTASLKGHSRTPSECKLNAASNKVICHQSKLSSVFISDYNLNSRKLH